MESVVHDHQEAQGQIDCSPAFVERIDEVRVTAIAYSSGEVGGAVPDAGVMAQLQAAARDYVTEAGRFCKDVPHQDPRLCSTQTEIEYEDPGQVDPPANPMPYAPAEGTSPASEGNNPGG